MKKNKEGFTLVELLAVIVILGIIMVIVGNNLTGTKKEANIEEAKQLENNIKTLGSDVYLSEKKIKDYDISELTSYGLSSTIKNPSGNGTCSGYLRITSDLEFEGHICCPGLYMTGSDQEPTESDCADTNRY